jgi:hypothetical protein
VDGSSNGYLKTGWFGGVFWENLPITLGDVKSIEVIRNIAKPSAQTQHLPRTPKRASARYLGFRFDSTPEPQRNLLRSSRLIGIYR